MESFKTPRCSTCANDAIRVRRPLVRDLEEVARWLQPRSQRYASALRQFPQSALRDHNLWKCDFRISKYMGYCN